MFIANYAYADAYYPKALYAQSRGVFRKGGHFGGNSGNIGRNYAFGKKNMNFQPRMFNGRNSRNGYGRGPFFCQNSFHSFQAPRNLSLYARGGFTGMNGSQGNSSNVEELTYQICFKSGHIADIWWHRFVEDYIPFARGSGKGKRTKISLSC